jgi:hypothetical protein
VRVVPGDGQGALSARRPSGAGALGPILFAVLLTFSGEAVIFVGFGVLLFPGGDLLAKAWWTGTCGIAMGLAIGAIVLLLQAAIRDRRALALAAGLAYCAVLAHCVAICFAIDRQIGYFGAAEVPGLFIWSGLIAAAATAPLYGWCVYRGAGRRNASVAAADEG